MKNWVEIEHSDLRGDGEKKDGASGSSGGGGGDDEEDPEVIKSYQLSFYVYTYFS